MAEKMPSSAWLTTAHRITRHDTILHRLQWRRPHRWNSWYGRGSVVWIKGAIFLLHFLLIDLNKKWTMDAIGRSPRNNNCLQWNRVHIKNLKTPRCDLYLDRGSVHVDWNDMMHRATVNELIVPWCHGQSCCFACSNFDPIMTFDDCYYIIFSTQ